MTRLDIERIGGLGVCVIGIAPQRQILDIDRGALDADAGRLQIVGGRLALYVERPIRNAVSKWQAAIYPNNQALIDIGKTKSIRARLFEIGRLLVQFLFVLEQGADPCAEVPARLKAIDSLGKLRD